MLADESDRCGAWSAEDRADALAALDRVDGLVATVRARLLVAERDAGTAIRPGDASFEAAHARRSRVGPAGAARQVRQADALASMPAIADALAAGSLPVSHLDAVARTAAAASPAVGALLTSASGQSTVLAMARAHDAPAFARSLTGWVAAHDPAALEDGHQAQRRARFLHLSHQADGTFVRGRLDSMAGHRLQLALEATGQSPDDDRSAEQARADALAALADRALCAPETTSGTSQRAHVSVLVDAETLAEVRARHERFDAASGLQGAPGALGPEADLTTGTASARTAAALTTERTATPDRATTRDGMVRPATLEDGTPVPASELARLLCDSELTRMVLTAESVPLDLGRTVRTYTGTQRRAVVARDRRCAWPSCATPARWGEVHHIRWWDRDGGRTSVTNGVLLCSFHHHEVHRRNLTIERHTSPPSPARPRGGDGSASGAAGQRPAGGLAASASARDPARSEPAHRQAPPGSGPPDRRAPARYTFRTPDGRVVAAPP